MSVYRKPKRERKHIAFSISEASKKVIFACSQAEKEGLMILSAHVVDGKPAMIVTQGNKKPHNATHTAGQLIAAGIKIEWRI